MTTAEDPESQPEQYDVPGARPEPTDPLSELGETPVERTASPRDPQAMPPVAGAADPLVLKDGLTPTPVVPDPAQPGPDAEPGRGVDTPAQPGTPGQPGTGEAQGPVARNADHPSTGSGDDPTAGLGGERARDDEAGEGPNARGDD